MSVAVVAIIGVAYLIFSPQLPAVESLKDVQLQTPLKVYSQEGELIAIYGNQRRVPLEYNEIPPLVVNAFLAAEDDRFFEHPGVDYQGLLRAAINLVLTGQKDQGGSTITMQVARNFFLTPERTYTRKIKEIFLALKIEGTLSKQEILALYLNKIYLGQRAYGLGAAAEVYYGKNVFDLTLPQAAMIAGLPKAPSRFNPVSNVKRATVRRDYVLGRMFKLNKITTQEYEEALLTPVEAKKFAVKIEVDAPYVGEMVRAHMFDLYGEEAYTSGFNVYTTIEADKQLAAVNALQNGLLAYDLRHGYRGPEGNVSAEQLQDLELVSERLSEIPKVVNLVPGIVLEANEETARIAIDSEMITLDLESVKWANPYKSHNSRGPAPKSVSEVLTAGDIIRVYQDDNSWKLGQVPDAASALVSLNPEDGAINALVGGFDFYSSKFNRVVQAFRQPGSSFKPFIYSAALEAGFTPATTINDAPVVFENKQQGESWRPQNYSGKFYGPTRMRSALTKSRNMVSIRILRDIGRKFTREHAGKFGFNTEELPKDLTLALGSLAVTPLKLAEAYSVFANGGYKVEPYYIKRIEGADSEVLFLENPARVCDQECMRLALEISMHNEELSELGLTESEGIEDAETRVAPRVIPESNSYQMDSMLKDVIQYGTGRRAKALKRTDIAGKTGTTNEQKDAWFAGYHPTAVTIVWVGFDDHEPLGRGETGGVAALPIWIDFMEVALREAPYIEPSLPEGMVMLKVDPKTGFIVDDLDPRGINEAFLESQIPGASLSGTSQVRQPLQPPEVIIDGSSGALPEQLF
ncbi:MAG: penicillin-binding protein 1A [Pseudomonadota bacterium]